MSNRKQYSRFQAGSALFNCRSCGRRTRDVNGSNGGVLMCEECEQGSMWENGGNDASDEETRDKCYAKSNEYFQAAVNLGGVIEGYAKQES